MSWSACGSSSSPTGSAAPRPTFATSTPSAGLRRRASWLATGTRWSCSRGAGETSWACSGRRSDSGRVALAASAATHAVLPLMATRAGIALQIETGLRSHRRRFGWEGGFWLPECAYVPGLEWRLAEHGVRWFCLNQSAHEPGTAALSPAATEAGPVAFTIDWEAVQWLWSLDGYPSSDRLRPVRRAFAAGHEDVEDRRRALRPWRSRGGGGPPRGRVLRRRGGPARGSSRFGRRTRPARLRGRHGADRALVVGGPDLARRGAAAGARARLAAADPAAGAQRARAQGAAAR